ncbi:G-type lectin S-receptor-like serine/threonine-protein kinase LECRK3 [Momordica charantia]|uniref:Receptor-like serine/threonine-protein kinase n=1 Tax=Momordica charantia TaxID=3673 RepID=A0A6J1D4X5_MOMCH|nr:G-type lectin S-receptor-like serine/threonine-protein kinase LECRK3 [Momordica charantia]
MASPLGPILLLLLLFLSPSSILILAQTYTNVTLDSSLTARTDGSFWPSKSGDFAFGFLQSGDGGGDYLLAIWFNKIAEKTVVWSANRDKLAPGGSIVSLTRSGQLVLSGPRGDQIWSANLAGGNQTVSYAAMLDNGNFILAARDSEILWQTFDVPTDTILPSQTVSQGKSLFASYSQTNYSSGRFQLAMQPDGNLVLYPTQFPTDTRSRAYWATATVGSGFQLVFNLSGSIYLIAKNETILEFLTSDTPPTQNFYHRAILEDDGVFRQYVYPKIGSGSNSSWPKAWSQVSDSTPSNICTALNDGTVSGACGFNSYCRLGNNQRPYCTCPPGYDLLDPDDVIKGCKPKFVSQSCDASFPEADDFEFSPLENADWPQADYAHFQPVNEDWCRSECLSDCFCVAAIFRNGECWKKKFPLSFGRMDSSVGGKALIKIRKDNSTFRPYNPSDKHTNKTKLVVGSVLLGSSVFLNLTLLLLTFLIGYRFNKRKSKVLQGDPLALGVNLRAFSYEELDKATVGFTEQLGSGAFATVYKGTLDDNNLVAVKKLDNMVREGGEQEFKAEVSAIARTNHRNLVRLLGFCNEGENRMLVYEFMHNGSLADFLFGPSKPNWYQRIQLVLGTARGLSYLHEECSTQIIHCDIKPQNILLDDSFAARIADFGLAKLLNKNQTRTMTAIRGTKGYVAPEWFRSLPITVKVDVYSFGILLLEIICCRKNFELEAKNEDEMVLSDWAYDCMRERKVEMLVRNDEEAKNDIKRVEKFVMIAIWCIQEEPSLRPSMKKVIQMLEGAVQVSTPPDPSSFISTIQ